MDTLLEVCFTFPPEAQEHLGELLLEFGLPGFVEGSPRADFPNQGLVTCYVHDALQLESLLRFIRAHLAEEHETKLSWRTPPIQREQWKCAWKKYAVPITVHSGLRIVPAWVPLEMPSHGGMVIRIETTRAFGTGSHPTTLLCLSFLEELLATSSVERMLDIGCGSGILAILGALRGVPSVTAIDIDPEAVHVARENAAANGCHGISFQTQPASALAECSEEFDLVCANLLLPIFRDNALAIRNTVKQRGLLIASGFVFSDLPELTRLLNMPLALSRKREGWGGVVFRR